MLVALLCVGCEEVRLPVCSASRAERFGYSVPCVGQIIGVAR